MENDINDSPGKLNLRKRKTQPDSAAAEANESSVLGNHSETSSGKGSTVSEDDGIALGDSVMKQIVLQKIQERVKVLRNSLVDQIEAELSNLTERFLMELQTAETVQKNTAFYGETGVRPRREKRPSGSLPDKVFLPRNSLLTDLFEVNHIQTIYHIFIAILILLFVNTLTYDVVDTGRLNLDFDLIQWAFGNFRSVLFIWVAMMSSTMVLVYPAFHLWANKRVLMKIPSLQQRLWDYLWLAAYVAYLVLAIYAPAKEVVIHQLPPASSAIILMEQVRLIMKTHAFVRSNIPRALNYTSFRNTASKVENEDDDEEYSPCPDFSKYLYFLFAPTLVYRSNYPRTLRIRWKWVVWNFLQVVGVLFYLYFIFVRFMVPVFRQFGHEPLTAKALVLSVFGCVMPGILVLLCGFFALLHAWLNAFAEMLRFADRMFYKDWWNSSSYAVYYRTWNVVVHDWLYTYVYKDVYELCCRKNRVVPMLVVFAVSAIVHEFILSFVFRFFCPILLLLFGGFGMGFAMITNVESRVGNIFMWLTLFMGTGMIVSVYSMEWYARINCRPLWDGWLDYLVPRSLTCHAAHHP